MKSYDYHLSLKIDIPQAFLVYPLKNCNPCSSTFTKIAEFVDWYPTLYLKKFLKNCLIIPILLSIFSAIEVSKKKKNPSYVLLEWPYSCENVGMQS